MLQINLDRNSNKRFQQTIVELTAQVEEEVILSSDDECEYKKHSRNNDQTFSGTENENEDEEDDENLPSGAECMKRCREFASITETDTALAMFYLQNNKWDLEVPFFSKWLFSNNFECLI